MSAEHLHEVINNYTYDQVKIDQEYVVSRRSDDRITIAWSSRYGVGKAVMDACNRQGEPISHMNGRLAQYRWPNSLIEKGMSENDMPVPDILHLVAHEPERILRAQLPFNGMAVAWAKVPDADKDMRIEPFQVQLTAEQKISRAALFGAMLDSASPQIHANISDVLAALEYDFQPLALGDAFRSDEWQAMHKLAS